MLSMNDSKLNRLSGEDIHSICSAQVITGLPSVIKELIENAIDAKATSIEVRFRDYGLKSLEVIDNGIGIAEKDLDTVCVSRSTSKLATFEDLGNISTFGFRGEALHSLSGVAKVSIVSRTANSEQAFRIEFDVGGKVISKRVFPREVGTTLIVSNLFDQMPVRRRDLERNSKKHFANCLSILKSYAVVSQAVRFYCSNSVKTGQISKLFDVLSSETMRTNISCVFSLHEAKELLDFKQDNDISEEILEEFPVKQQLLQRVNEIKVEGLVASVGTLSSEVSNKTLRASCDRQFIFINRRPANINRLQKLINQFYKPLTCRNVYPAFFLNIDLSECKDLLDINVSPDKREIFIACENLLLAIVKNSLTKLLGSGTNRKIEEMQEDVNVSIVPALESKPSVAKSSNKVNLKEEPALKRPKVKQPPIVDRNSVIISKIPADFNGSLIGGENHQCYNDAIVCDVEGDLAESKVFNKTDFTNLEICGQFNSSFIIAKLDGKLFIIDQHAADERWNFECLQKATENDGGVKIQALIAPKKLQIPADTEICLKDNLDLVNRNGFRFVEDSQGHLLLSAVPSVVGNAGRTCLFGQHDLEELLSLLSEDGVGDANSKPSRLRRIHASRACRRAIMAGESLNYNAMKKILLQRNISFITVTV